MFTAGQQTLSALVKFVYNVSLKRCSACSSLCKTESRQVVSASIVRRFGLLVRRHFAFAWTGAMNQHESWTDTISELCWLISSKSGELVSVFAAADVRVRRRTYWSLLVGYTNSH